MRSHREETSPYASLFCGGGSERDGALRHLFVPAPGGFLTESLVQTRGGQSLFHGAGAQYQRESGQGNRGRRGTVDDAEMLVVPRASDLYAREQVRTLTLSVVLFLFFVLCC